jgi:protein-disulfide isomerase/uncharacterized membrane protein
MSDRVKKVLIFILALCGFLISLKLAFIYYSANYDKYALSSFCSVNDFIDCDGIARTNTAQFLGIPLAYWGMFLYLTIFFLIFVEKLKKIPFLKFLNVFKNPLSYITALGTISFSISVILLLISLIQIKKICILCAVTYVIDLFIALVASSFNFKSIMEAFKNTYYDFIEGAKQYKKTFIILLVLSISFLSYSRFTYCFLPHMKTKSNLIKYQKMKRNPYRAEGNTLGNPDGDVKIVIYSDFVCPLCYINNIMIHQAVKEFSNISVTHMNYPFDKECNKSILINMHPHACFMWKGAIAAENQGNYWGMNSLLYENQPKKFDDMLKLAQKLNLDTEKFTKDFYSEKTEQEMNKILEKGTALGIDATPTMYINDEKFVGVKPYYKLKEILIEHGAKK